MLYQLKLIPLADRRFIVGSGETAYLLLCEALPMIEKQTVAWILWDWNQGVSDHIHTVVLGNYSAEDTARIQAVFNHPAYILQAEQIV